jgi:hypothetical protein
LCFFFEIIIIFTFVFWNSLFDSSSSMQVIRCLVVDLAFDGEWLSSVSFCAEIYTSGVVFG